MTFDKSLQIGRTQVKMLFFILIFFNIIMISKHSFAIVWNFIDMPILAYLAWPKKTRTRRMSLKSQTMANECFEIMMILKNMKIVKSILTCVLQIWRLFVKCHINWLLMTKKSIQMVKLETFDFKLKLKLVIEKVNPLGTSLDSATNV